MIASRLRQSPVSVWLVPKAHTWWNAEATHARRVPECCQWRGYPILRAILRSRRLRPVSGMTRMWQRWSWQRSDTTRSTGPRNHRPITRLRSGSQSRSPFPSGIRQGGQLIENPQSGVPCQQDPTRTAHRPRSHSVRKPLGAIRLHGGLGRTVWVWHANSC